MLLLPAQSFGLDCSSDFLAENADSGSTLITSSGNIYNVLAGDNITSMLWLPMSSLQVCGPNTLNHNGKTYELYKIINTDDGDSVGALRINTAKSSTNSTSSCYETFITSPTPFNGNGGELIQLGDGSIWKDLSYQYLYLYEYNPPVTICPKKGLLIVGDNTFNVVKVN